MEMQNDLGILESLDFTPALPCEHSQHHTGKFGHSGPGVVLIQVHCPHCDLNKQIVVCRGWWEKSLNLKLRCSVCKSYSEPHEHWTFIKDLERK